MPMAAWFELDFSETMKRAVPPTMPLLGGVVGRDDARVREVDLGDGDDGHVEDVGAANGLDGDLGVAGVVREQRDDVALGGDDGDRSRVGAGRGR